MPAYVTGEGEPYRPDILVWMGADGMILGSAVARPGEILAMASDSLQATIEQPMAGTPHRPARVRVASAELADALRSGHPELDVVCAPTPEIDEMLAEMRHKMDVDGTNEPTYLVSEITPDAMASFFEAAAALFRAQPWNRIPGDESLLSVTIEQFGIRDAALSVIGQLGQSFGFILFAGIDAFETYVDGAVAIDRGEEAEMPPHFAMTFERGSDLAPGLRKEVAKHQWEIAGKNAYPWPVVIDEDLVPRPPTGKEVVLAEAIARALTRIMDEEAALRTAWDLGEPVLRTFRVITHEGDVEVTLGTSFMSEQDELDADDDLVTRLAGLALDSDEIDPDARGLLEDELLVRFAASPEGKDLEEIDACRMVMDLAANHLGDTIATLGPTDLREVLFELIPLKVSIDASGARVIVEVTRALYTFLKREFDLDQADSCLRVLGKSAVRRLEAALSDSSNFGMAKSLFMAGKEAGFDMQSQQGIDAWMESLRGKPLPPSIAIPGPGVPQRPPRKAAKAKKNKRKAARKSRKRRN
jgi:hypothetical protein